MTVNIINQLGELNPQLFRELKGRLIPRNILISVAAALLGQLLLLMSFSSKLPVLDENNANSLANPFCTGSRKEYSSPLCISDNLGGFFINWELWWERVFLWMSLIGIFSLLVVGTYMLIADLSKEEGKGTLNFLRLTPSSSMNILGGKLLGVPILLYLGIALAIPLHLTAAFSADIPAIHIVGFYGVIVASCLFFYSAALLFGLVGNWLGTFQAWLGAGTVLMFLFIMTNAINYSQSLNAPFDWLSLFHPAILLPYLIGGHFLDNPAYNYDGGENGFLNLLWFYLPVGSKGLSISALAIANCGLWSYLMWEGLKRYFHNPHATLLSKRQSYLLTACFNFILLGFAMNPKVEEWKSYPKGVFENWQILMVFNLILFLGLIAALSPHRQAMQDWARYRHQKLSVRKGGIVAELIWGKTSPAVLAVVMNSAIASLIILPWILLWPDNQYKEPALWGLILNMSIIVLYASIVQLMLFMKTPKRAIWAAGTVMGLIILPPIVFAFLSLSSDSSAWLVSGFPWATIENAATSSVLMAIVAESLGLVLLNVQLNRQLRRAGESATKALLYGRSSMAIQ
ncbi:MAG TPA: ABC transporter permease [Cyanobacteria bacterium UBA11149]|nr:ABC transporter permease [Cyanobacteria bacterium UBA11367]HBE56333.1 ABC transporter permease [Cyanobacteria bacterium UBA11366]HBK65953.1 ABC transporter permease [Cyanobacteria bacterium UBA11166]HBR76264.1 ABC transporter permease [Cyanobacteria bacterium UBA11159]HBS70499.1 ABC transporter permease [Cyanobacteria bacterium UBA11153]HBW91855.1 ABC transporter permease [Cyanobacteria bacterium UBA11149]